jgi:hypothetical protein
MNIEQMHAHMDADFGGPSMRALPAFPGDKLRPHKSGGGGGSSTTTQSIPNELKPLAAEYSKQAMELSKTPFNPYTGDRFADLNQAQNSGIDMIQQRAQNGSATVNNAEQALNQNIQGGQSNPYLDSMVGRAQDSVRSQFNTGAVTSGSFGNSGLQEQFQRGLGDVASQMYGQAYEGDKARQMQSIGMAQQFGNQQYQDAGQMLQAGQIQQDQAQQGQDFNYQQFQEQENDPYKKLAAMSGVFSSGLGTTQTSKQSGGGK